VFTDLFKPLRPRPEFSHPGRRMSADEMHARGFADIEAALTGDPDFRLPQICSVCRDRATPDNPLRLTPIDRSPRNLLRSYLYRSECARCAERRAA
jgi:hypothetical protein